MHKAHAGEHSAAAFGWALVQQALEQLPGAFARSRRETRRNVVLGNLCRSRNPAGNGDVASIPCQKSATPWLTATGANQDETKNGGAWFVSPGRQKLDTYVDGEVPEVEMRTLDAHLRSCHFCSADALTRVQMKSTIQVSGKRFTPSAEFRRRVQVGIALKPQRSLGLGWMFVAAAVIHRGRELDFSLSGNSIRQRSGS